MKSISRLAVVAALAAVTVTAPAVAQKKGKEQPAAAAAAGPTLPKPSKAAQSLLAQAQTAQGANDHAGAVALLNQVAALPKATTGDKAWAYRIMVNSALATKNNDLLKQSVEGYLGTGLASPIEEVKFRTALRGLALQAKNYPTAVQQAQRLAQLSPNDANLAFELAQVHQLAGQPREAYAATMKAIDVAKAAGNVPEDYYRTAAKLALDNKMTNEFTTASAAWLAGYPTAENWRTVLSLFRDSANFDDQGSLDVFRLMHATGSLGSEKDYYEYAETANSRGYPGESKLILDEGLSKGKLTTAKAYTKELQALVNPKVARDKASLPGLEADAKKAANGKLALSTGDAYLGHGNYAKAAELYRLALQKGGVDAATANTRLGIALGRGGQKAEAEAAFKAVNGGGPRQQLAQYWLIWLGRQA